MMAIHERRVHYSYTEYLVLEQAGATKHEYLDGEIYAMAGGSPDHAALAASMIGILRAQLPPDCRVFSSDLRVRIAASGLSTYPDAAVVCGRTERATDDALAVVNPVVLVEVTSPATEEYDRGAKLSHYELLESVREIVLVSHRAPEVTVHRRRGEVWESTVYAASGTVELSSIGVAVALDDLYRGGLEDATT